MVTEKIKLNLNKIQPFQSPRDTLAFPLANEFHTETRVRAIQKLAVLWFCEDIYGVLP